MSATAERPESQSVRQPDENGPYLILVAFYSATDKTDAVAELVGESEFPTPDGWPRGAVVAFRREVSTGYDFKRTLRRLDLAELCDTPTKAG